MKVSTVALKRILATVAMMFLLLRPVCDVLAASVIPGEQGQDAHSVAHQDTGGGSAHDHNVPCCADVEDGAVAAPSDLANGRVTGESKPVFAALARAMTDFAGAPSAGARHPPGAPFTSSSFYARTARIRR